MSNPKPCKHLSPSSWEVAPDKRIFWCSRCGALCLGAVWMIPSYDRAVVEPLRLEPSK